MKREDLRELRDRSEDYDRLLSAQYSNRVLIALGEEKTQSMKQVDQGHRHRWNLHFRQAKNP